MPTYTCCSAKQCARRTASTLTSWGTPTPYDYIIQSYCTYHILCIISGDSQDESDFSTVS